MVASDFSGSILVLSWEEERAEQERRLRASRARVLAAEESNAQRQAIKTIAEAEAAVKAAAAAAQQDVELVARLEAERREKELAEYVASIPWKIVQVAWRWMESGKDASDAIRNLLGAHRDESQRLEALRRKKPR